MKLKICLMALLCLFFCAKAQTISKENAPNQYLKIGDHVPDVLITNIINSGPRIARISDYKGKVIILDFWNTWCSACIKAFPEWDAFQHQYGNDLKVFLVNKKSNSDTEKRIKNVISLTSDVLGKPFRLPIVMADTTLIKYFNFNTVPHIVWIDRQGTVIAITASQSVSPENMAKVIHGEAVDFPVKTMKEFN